MLLECSGVVVVTGLRISCLSPVICEPLFPRLQGGVT